MQGRCPLHHGAWVEKPSCNRALDCCTRIDHDSDQRQMHRRPGILDRPTNRRALARPTISNSFARLPVGRDPTSNQLSHHRLLPLSRNDNIACALKFALRNADTLRNCRMQNITKAVGISTRYLCRPYWFHTVTTFLMNKLP